MIKANGNELTINGKSVMLAKSLMAMFKMLRDNSPEVVAESEMMGALGIARRHTLTQKMSMLRKMIGCFKCINIVTHSGVGYAMHVDDAMMQPEMTIEDLLKMDGQSACDWLIENKDKYDLVAK